jgi:hypothetical protein
MEKTDGGLRRELGRVIAESWDETPKLGPMTGEPGAQVLSEAEFFSVGDETVWR